jgi:SulP family sulfate permease
MMTLSNSIPLLKQLANYNRSKLGSDLIAAVVVTIMLIPQSLAYAMLAGLPPEYGLYASIMPIVVYSIFGTSTTLAIGPVAIASIMTASALSVVTQAGLISYIDGAITLALLSGLFLMLLGVLRFGFIANFLSHSVVAGFITASGLLIALSQMKHLLGVKMSGHTFFDMAASLLSLFNQAHFITLIIGIGSLVFLLLARNYAARCLTLFGFSLAAAKTLARIAPVIGVVATTVIVASLGLDQKGVAIVGEVPRGMGQLALPSFNLAAIKALILPAIFISIIGYVESISVGRTLAAKRHEKIAANQELFALGGANVASGLMGAFPVTGGFSRSVVNFDAGAQTQFAGIYTAIAIAIASFFLTPFLYFLPIAMLAATIIVAVLSLVDFSVIRHAWHFSKSDFYAIAMTIMLTLLLGVEAGVASGIIASIILHLYHTSRPHVAEIGLLPNGEHFRNVNHYKVETIPEITSLRIDESLLFSNANYIEEYIDSLVNKRPKTQHIILHCGAINTIDLSALEMLEALNTRLLQSNIQLHFSEVKIPVKHLLDKARFFDRLGGELFLSQYEAYEALSKRYR